MVQRKPAIEYVPPDCPRRNPANWGYTMSRFKVSISLSLALLLLSSAAEVRAGTLYVNCGGKGALTSIAAALKALQYSEGHGPSTINVSGACNENVVIQSLDRLTLNAAPGASINDNPSAPWQQL